MDLDIVKKLYTGVGKLLGGVNPLPYILQGVVPTVADNAVGEGTFNSIKGKYLGINMTGQELQNAELNFQNQLRMMREGPQAQVEGAERAGINPAFALTGSAHIPSAGNTSSISSGGSLSDLIAIATLPAQLKQINAQTENIQASTKLTNQRTLTEEQITKLQSIAVEWQPSLNGEQIAQMSANIDKIQSDINLNKANKDYITNQSIAQVITNEYLPKRLLSEIDKLDSDARNARASAAITEVQAKFAKDNGFLMSSNDMLLLGTYIASLFNIDKPDVVKVVEDGVKYVKEELPKDLRPWHKPSQDEAMNWFLEHAKHSTSN